MYRSRRPRPQPRPHFVRKLNQIGTHQRLVKVLGSLTLLKAMAEEMNLRAIVDARVPWQGPAGSLTRGEVVEALVLNRLHAPRPLYRFDQWAAVVWQTSTAFRPIGSTTTGSGKPWTPFRRTTRRSRVTWPSGPSPTSASRRVLYDITSLYFEGEYEASEIIEYGYSRDQKPDKKQINLALTDPDANWVLEEIPYRGASGKGSYWVTEMAIPVVHEEVRSDQPPPAR